MLIIKYIHIKYIYSQSCFSWTMVQLSTLCPGPVCPGFLFGLLFKVSAFGLDVPSLGFGEKLRNPVYPKLFAHFFALVTVPRRVQSIVKDCWLFLKFKQKFKNVYILYFDNFMYLFSLHLIHYHSVANLLHFCYLNWHT